MLACYSELVLAFTWWSGAVGGQDFNWGGAWTLNIKHNCNKSAI